MQEIINQLLPFIYKGKRKQALAALGFVPASELARRSGCSRQYISALKGRGRLRFIVYEGREYYHPPHQQPHLAVNEGRKEGAE